MKFKRLFFDDYIKFENISKRHLIFCIIIGLLSSFSIYSAFYVLRETFRLMSFSYEFAPNIFSEENRWISNLFYAYLSLVFGNSIAISILFRRPQKVISRRNTKRERILNDQVFLNLNFMYWFGKMGITFGIMSISMLDFQFFPEYYIPFILLILVMYIETWKTLLRVIKRKKHIHMFFHFIILSCLAFGFSKIDIVDYKKVDESLMRTNPKMNLSKSFFHDNVENHYKNPITHYKLILEDNDSLVIIFEGYKRMRLQDVVYSIAAERASLREEIVPRLLVSVSANKDLKLKYIKQFEAELFSVSQKRIRYEVLNENIETYRFVSHGFNRNLNESVLKHKKNHGILLPPFPPIPEYLGGIVFKDTVEVSVGRDIKFSHLVVNEKDLVKLFEKNFSKTTLFEYRFSSNVAYQKYIVVISAHIKAINNLRENNAPKNINFSEPTYWLSSKDREKLYELKKRFPIYYKEIIE